MPVAARPPAFSDLETLAFVTITSPALKASSKKFLDIAPG